MAEQWGSGGKRLRQNGRMSNQPITPELRQWIVAQATSGQSAEAVLQAMRASGWHEDVAIAAMEETMVAFVAEQSRAAGLPLPVAVPEPLTGTPRARLAAGDREVSVLAALREPRVVVFGGLLTSDECEELIALARQRLARSETVENETGGTAVNVARTSDGMFFQRGEHPLCGRLEARIAALLDWPVENGEGLQVLRYRPGAEYKPHYDYFDPDQPGSANLLARGGQRVASVVCYLNTPRTGGATVFPDAGLEVAAVQGNAVFFSYSRPHPVTRSLHAGAPVIEGEKWVATKWLRERRFD
jgi:prolyl 4-hydroxylase